MSTTAEPTSSTKQNDMAGTSDVPASTDPSKIGGDLAANPALDDLAKMKKTLEEELEGSEKGVADAAENGTDVDPEADQKTIETTSTEADRLRAMMAAQSMQGMNGMNGKVGLPLLEETIKAVMRLLKKLLDFIFRRKSTPEFGTGNPALLAAADGAATKVDAADGAVNDALKDMKNNKQLEHDTANELDSLTPGAPGGAGPGTK
jgi:F0F1-type ATP synthase membrane subunit b/b'